MKVDQLSSQDGIMKLESNKDEEEKVKINREDKSKGVHVCIVYCHFSCYVQYLMLLTATVLPLTAVYSVSEVRCTLNVLYSITSYIQHVVSHTNVQGTHTLL